MRISAKVEYACIAMLELAANHGTGRPVRVGRIAADHGIPPRFLVQILLQLKGAGLVKSVRGATGGYRLLKRPNEISLAAVMRVMAGRDELISNVGRHSLTACVLMDAWRDIARREDEMLASTTLADMLEEIQNRGEPTYYI